MKATIILVLVVVVAGLFWIKAFHTSTFAPVAVTQKTAAHSNGYYHTSYLQIEPASERYRFKELQLYPIIASEEFLHHHQFLGPYLSLQEALDHQKIVVTELTGEDSRTSTSPTADMEEAEVNRLFVENVSADTIIILGGEVVRGGKQDRMIAKDFMIFPNSGRIDIDVYCVEHGRWTNSPNDILFESTQEVAPNKVRKAARASHAQEKVWEEVEVLHEAFDIQSPTEALAAAVDDIKMTESVQPYKEYFQHIEWPENVVGVVAVRGNELVNIDIFAQHTLFTKYYPALLSSYCNDTNVAVGSALLPYSRVRTLLQELIGNEKTLEHRIQMQGTQLKHGRYRIHVAAH